MAIPWMVLLRNVPWTDVIRTAPKVAEGAKKLWDTVGGKTPRRPSPDGGMEAASSSEPLSSEPRSTESRTIADLQARLATLETTATNLHDQMLASSELIKTLAEQNAQLVARVEAHRVRVMWLAGALVMLGIITVLGLVLALIR
ncbi:MAG: hypothetical protein KBF24_05210 [Thiobacillaceae bacterium]|jgi:hypothetical protein|nr:hypothetical protein [Hydrogenophilales bacterium]MBP9915590.1 hypothetical protein [Thiobacillaceae bacterium]